MNVKQLIAVLETYDPTFEVVYRCCSEYVLLDEGDIKLTSLCLPRPDGWVANKRPDKPNKIYLAFPGN